MRYETGPPGPRCGESRGGQSPANAQQLDHHIRSYDQLSRQAAWWEVHQWRDRVLERYGVHGFPTVGTPAWVALPDTHPAKLAAAIDAAQHWALRVETCQEAQCEASRAISAAVDWAAVGRRNQRHAEFYAENPWARRVAL